jgi:uncharacterized protein
MRLIAVTVAFLCLLLPAALCPGALAAPKFPALPNFPKLSGRVVDDANILSSDTKADLTRKLATLEQKNSRQLVVVTIPSLGGYEISDYGYQLGRAWGLGQKTLNNGILLIVAPNEHKTRIEVGYGLEPIITDAFSSVVIQTQVLPQFRKGDFNAGVEGGVDALIQQLSLETSEAEKRAAAAASLPHGDSGQDMPGWMVLLIFFGIFGFIWLRSWRHPGAGGSGGSYWGGGGGGGWSGGGGGSFGGGFGGGGGSFGGGGSSGSW